MSLEPGNVWHETASIKIKYEPETKDPYNDPKVMEIYNKIKKEEKEKE